MKRFRWLWALGSGSWAQNSKHITQNTFFLFFFLLCLSSCTTEYNLATKQQETLMYNTDREVQIGEAVARSIENHYKDKILTDVDVNERVENILKRIVAVCDRKDLVFFIKVIDEDIMNAVSLPGGYMYVFKGLLDKVESDDELAGVIAHEVGHITAKHALKRLQNSYGAMLLQVAAATTKARNVSGGLGFALNSLFMQHSQADEFQSDQLGVKYLRAAGYDATAMTRVLEKLEAEHQKAPIREYSYWRTHPYLIERIGMANKEVTGKLEFRDYIRTIGHE